MQIIMSNIATTHKSPRPTRIAPSPNISAWALRLLLFMPILFLAFPAFSKMLSGIAVNSAFPVHIYITMNVEMPKASYEAAAQRLSEAPDADGQTIIARAEAESLSGGPSSVTANLASEGLIRAPANARGWLVYGEAMMDTDPQLAARALTFAFQLSPYDYWIAARRANDAAGLYSYLDDEGQAYAKRQARLLWEEPRLQKELPLFMSNAANASLMTEAYQDAPDELRALNRWLAKWRRTHNRSPKSP